MNNNIIGIATYRNEDWEKLREISSDSVNIEKYWYEWIDNKNRYENELNKKGIHFEEVLIDINELICFCKKENMEVNSESRSKFVTNKMRMKK